MTPEPRSEADYSPRQTEAARRVLEDVGQKVSVSRRYLEVLSRGYPVYNTREQFGDAAT